MVHKHHYEYETYEGNDRLICNAEGCTMRWPGKYELNEMEDVFEAAVAFLQHNKTLIHDLNQVFSTVGMLSTVEPAPIMKLYKAVMATGRIDEEENLGESR